ncbi:MAG: adenosine deaminase [Elusimicrobia bacterium]|nr:adenosine deaminase [Elusimicrobiota bacterium]
MRPLPAPLRAAARRVPRTPEALARLIAALPKVETHLHLDGAVSAETAARLAADAPGSPLRGLPVEEVRRRVVVDRPRAALPEVLAAFGAFYPLLRSAAAVELVAYELLREAARQNVLYSEVRFAPVLQAAEGFPPEAALDAALRGLSRGRADFGADSGVIICLLRPFSAVSREDNAAMAALAVSRAGRGVVGLDVADAGAGDARLADYGPWFQAARAAGLGLTAHAGEAGRPGELEDALALGVDRIGHGVALRESPALRAEVRRRGIFVEANPTSNLRTGAVSSYAAHPLKSWREEGLAVAVSTDDPGVFGVDLNHEYEVLARELGFGPEDLLEVAWAGVESAFVPAAERRALAERFEERARAALESPFPAGRTRSTSERPRRP